jgi:dipeptidyl aminopeptidase/acylaminoacyl peptidase
MRKFIATLAVLVWTVTVLPAQQSAPRRFGLDDFSRVVRVADPQIAPDGKSVAVVISRANLDEDRYDPDLVLVDVASAMSRALVTGKPGLANPRWAPDGQRLAFLVTAGTGSTAHLQVAVVPTSGGEPQILTSAPRAVQQFAWSPDSKTIATILGPELGAKRLALVDVATGSARSRAAPSRASASHPPATSSSTAATASPTASRRTATSTGPRSPAARRSVSPGTIAR